MRLRGGNTNLKQQATFTPALQSVKGNTALSMSSVATPPAPVEKFRKDYKPTDYKIGELSLTFKIEDGETEVLGSLQVKRAEGVEEGASLRLDAEDLALKKISIDGRELSESEYSWPESDVLEVKGPLPAAFNLETIVTINPEKNTQLSGLYQSSGMYCTQCEAEGFRRITPMLDRPDSMAKYKVRIEADKKKNPILLSNGNLVKQGDMDGGKHYAEWEDPFVKPSYLFALVAGNLGSIKDTYTTMSGRKVQLEIFSEHGNVDQLDCAMESLKQSMKWDEDTFGLEYDLDVYNIVAVGDFNMGAMENKGLNVFNTACVLASPATATDADFERVKGVIAHEYFHNWTGNRVTCRDWFQLTLKEGLTVFRDQQFSMDMTSEAVKRIEDVRVLRAAQFPQDSGPMAHPIRPESYIAMDNFYTATVYNKGAEVIGMYQTLLGKKGFRKGMDLYFERHDGQAVTCDDFRAAMSDANGVDLTQFERWYTQAGTPTVAVTSSYDEAAKELTVTLTQSWKPSPGQATKEPYHIPVRLGLLAKDGSELAPEQVLELREKSQTFTLKDIREAPVLSVLRGFSAPVKLQHDVSDAELAFLFANDQDPFNRWEAGQKLFTKAILDNVQAYEKEEDMALSPLLVDAVRDTLSATGIDRSLQAYALALPTLGTLAEELEVIDPEALLAAHKFTKRTLAEQLRPDFEKVYAANVLPEEPFRNDAEAVGMRRIKNTCLDYLASLDDAESQALLLKQALGSTCMTDLLAASNALASSSDDAACEKGRAHLYEKAKGNDLVLCKWFGTQAGSSRDDTLAQCTELLSHPDFSLTNPNKCRSIVGGFGGNMQHFHAKDGSGYKWMADRIIDIDKLNPQLSARMTAAFSSFRRYESGRQGLMEEQLQRLLATKGLSKDAFEIASRSIKG